MSESDLLELETLHVSGTPRAMGEAQGEALRDRVSAFVAMRFASVRGYLDERGLTDDGLLDAGRTSLEIHRRWDPDGIAEHEGIARAAGVDAVALYTATNMTDMRDVVALGGAPDAEGCSAILIPGSHSADGDALVGQTWDLNPPDVSYIVAIHRKPERGPQTWSVTCAGCLSLVGINSEGVAVGTTNIKTFGARPGVGYLGVLHKALGEPTAMQAGAAIEGAPRAGAHTFWAADATHQLEWEATPVSLVRRDTRHGPLHRTNHCLVAAHQRIEGEPPNDSSKARFARLTTLLARGDHDIERLQAVFADRSDGVHSVNRYEEDDQGTATNSVFIASPAARRAWACRGPADRGRWIELSF
jgi:isopenicillin-N N-acyltransferase-like protein